jgi:hypothetical protein
MKLLGDILGVRYELFELPALDELAEVLVEAFGRHEPMTIATGSSREELVAFVKLFGPKAAEEGVTIVARDLASGAMIGALLTDDFAAPPPEGFEQVGERFQPTLSMLEQMDAQYRQGRDIRAGEYLHLFMIGVSRASTGRKVARNLVGTCLENGLRKGYRVAVTEATGTVSQHIFRGWGFVDRLTVLYKEYNYKGRRVFESIEGHRGTILMDKELVRLEAAQAKK